MWTQLTKMPDTVKDKGWLRSMGAARTRGFSAALGSPDVQIPLGYNISKRCVRNYLVRLSLGRAAALFQLSRTLLSRIAPKYHRRGQNNLGNTEIAGTMLNSFGPEIRVILKGLNFRVSSRLIRNENPNS